jgi:glycosyltransferase involved in cell wall biosynthesis
MKVAFVYQQKASFVATDLQILTRHHNVDGVRFRGRRDIVRLWYAVADSDISFCWFGKLHAVFAVLFSKLCGRKSIVVAGGDDVANEPAIPYGLFAHPIKRWFALFILRHADLILAMSDYSRSQVLQHAGPDPSKVRRAYLGFDHRRIQRLPGMNKGGVVLTVGAVRRENLARKGLELFVRTAPLARRFDTAVAGNSIPQRRIHRGGNHAGVVEAVWGRQRIRSTLTTRGVWQLGR